MTPTPNEHRCIVAGTDAAPVTACGHTHRAPVMRSRVQQVAAVATGCAMGGAAVLVATFDPSSPGSRFPACGFHALTGLWCPGCGLTRATHHLLTGDPVAALATNLFTPVVLTAILVSWLAWAMRSFGRTLPLMSRSGVPPGLHRWGGPAAIIIVLAFGVLRNLPFAPFDALAP